jgi:DNA-binding NtrC family response regulator
MENPATVAETGSSAKTILLAEDEVLIRALAAEALREAGFTVIEASSADEAQSVIAAGLKPDLLFTDVRMPGAHDGLTLARELKTQLPHLIVVVASGHADPQDVNRHAFKFFAKPYDVDAVVAAIADALDHHER